MSGIIACFELTLALIKYYTESKRKKYNITIEKCSILIENIYNLRSLYLNIEKSSEKDLFNPEIISNSINKPIKKEMMRTLTIIEGIAEGMEKTSLITGYILI